MGFLTSRTIAPTVTTNDLVHIVITGDTSQGNPSGSSYKATIGQIGLAISTGNTITISGGTDISVTGSHPNFVISFTGTTSGDYLPLSGGTVSGGTIFTSGVTINSLTATTITNTYLDNFYVRDNGGTVSIDNTTRKLLKSDGFTTSFDWENGILTGQTNIESSTLSATTYLNLPNTVTGYYLPLSGGTVTGTTEFTSGITANTISATTYLNLPTYYNSTGITTSQSITWDKTYWGISGLTNVDITLPSTTSKDGYILIVKDEGGNAGTYRIRVTPLSGLIDDNTYIDMNINYMSLTFVARNNNWWII